MKYRVRVRGVPNQALAAKMEKVITAEVNKLEAQVAAYNASVKNMRNQATIQQAVQGVIARRIMGN